MKTFLLLPLLIAFFISAASPACGQAFDARQIFKRASPWIVTIIGCDDYGEPESQGSGFFLSSGDLVTSHHVLAGMSRAYYYDAHDNRVAITTVVADDAQRDLIKVRTTLTRSGSGAGLVLSRETPEEGEIVVAIGSPKGLSGTISEGIVSAIRRDEFMPQIIQTTAATSPGSSGCPLLNTTGEVIGIVESKWNAENVTFATPVTYLADMDDQLPTPLAEWAKNNPSAEQLARANHDNPDQFDDLGSWSASPDVPNDPERRSAMYYQQGFEQFHHFDIRGALRSFYQSAQADTLNGPAWFMIGNCLYTLESPVSAAHAFQRASVLLSGHLDEQQTFQLLMGLAQSYFAMQAPDSAIIYYRQALIFYPDDALALVGAGRSCLELHQDTEAYAHLTRAISTHGNLAEPYYFLSVLDQRWSRFANADSNVRSAIAISPDNPTYNSGLAEILWQEGKQTEAKEHFHRALTLYAEHPHYKYLNDLRTLSSVLRGMGLIAESEQASALANALMRGQ